MALNLDIFIIVEHIKPSHRPLWPTITSERIEALLSFEKCHVFDFFHPVVLKFISTDCFLQISLCI